MPTVNESESENENVFETEDGRSEDIGILRALARNFLGGSPVWCE